jgi:hypothetical protein
MGALFNMTNHDLQSSGIQSIESETSRPNENKRRKTSAFWPFSVSQTALKRKPHRSTINVKSELGNGVLFTVRRPLQEG